MELQTLKNYIIQRLQNELPTHFVYHSIEHTLDVYESACRIAENEQIAEEQMTLIQAAALLHDFGYIEQAEGHEAVSCHYAHQILPSFGYSNEAIEQICSMIMATKIPQNPQDKLSEILCDADLDYLGRTDFFEIGSRLFHEFLSFQIVKNEKEWHLKQEAFLSIHQYFTTYSKANRLAQKQINLSLVKDKLKTL